MTAQYNAGMATIHINRAGTNLGTFSEEDIKSGLRTGRFFGTDLAWKEGMPAWQPLSQFTEFATELASAAVARAAASPPMQPPEPSPPTGGAVPPFSGPSPSPTGAAAAGALPAALSTTSVEPRSGLPWDRRASLGLLKAFLETLQMVLTRPTEAFTVMKREGGLGEPLIYALIGGTIGTAMGLIYRLAFQMVAGNAFGNESWNHVLGSMGLVVAIIFSPIFVAIGIFIVAALVHVCLMIVGGARQPFETSFRVVCFTIGSTYPLQLVPGCGGFICAVWSIVLYCIGLARAHETETGRAVMAVLLPLIVCCGTIFLIGMLAGGIGVLSHNWH